MEEHKQTLPEILADKRRKQILLFSQFYDKGKEKQLAYEFRITNFTDGKLITDNERGGDYLVYDAIAQQDTELARKGQPVELHLAYRSFRNEFTRILEKTRSCFSLEKGTDYYVIIKFVRSNFKSPTILKFKLVKLNPNREGDKIVLIDYNAGVVENE